MRTGGGSSQSGGYCPHRAGGLVLLGGVAEGTAETQRVWVKKSSGGVEEIVGEEGERASAWITRRPRVLGFLGDCST